MKTLLIPAIGLVATVSVSASAQDGVDDERLVSPPAPPAPITLPPPPPAPLPPGDCKSPPQLISYSMIVAKPTDYPSEAWAAGHEGTVQFELLVDEEGLPQECTILES